MRFSTFHKIMNIDHFLHKNSKTKYEYLMMKDLANIIITAIQEKDVETLIYVVTTGNCPSSKQKRILGYILSTELASYKKSALVNLIENGINDW